MPVRFTFDDQLLNDTHHPQFYACGRITSRTATGFSRGLETSGFVVVCSPSIGDTLGLKTSFPERAMKNENPDVSLPISVHQ